VGSFPDIYFSGLNVVKAVCCKKLKKTRIKKIHAYLWVSVVFMFRSKIYMGSS
jgi:hypothetical protein